MSSKPNISAKFSTHAGPDARLEVPRAPPQSGSETDVSTSSENLSPEDHFALRHLQRQEPQGQEWLPDPLAVSNSGLYGRNSTVAAATRANESNISMSSSNTLIIHHGVADESWSRHWAPGGFASGDASRKTLSTDLQDAADLSALLNSSKMQLEPLNLNSSLLNASTLAESLRRTGGVNSYCSRVGGVGTESDLRDIPPSYLRQSEILKHLIAPSNKGVLGGANTLQGIQQLPPPPPYPNKVGDPPSPARRGALEKSLSRSQPDLVNATNLSEQLSPRLITGQTDDSDGSSLREMVDLLVQENNGLKLEVELYRRRIAKLQKFEMEIVKVHEAHESLVKLSERREQLERLARHKLHSELRRLTDSNRELRETTESLSGQLASRAAAEGGSDSLRREVGRRDVLIAQLVSQNKELLAAKERQKMELMAQRQTLNEQRTHIDILDSALTNAQANVVSLEEEVRKKQNLAEQAGQLKRLLLSLQLSADRREQSERLLRQKLEHEIETLRAGCKQDANGSQLSDLRRDLRSREEKVMILEGEVSKWEQRYLQESALRQLAIEAASGPKDAKIAALEKNSQESERRFAQSKTDKLRHMDEVHVMNKKLMEAEGRNKELESHLAEREAMIRALQKRTEEKEETTYQSLLIRSSLSSLRTSEGSTPGSAVHSAQHSSVSHSRHDSLVGGSKGGSVGVGTPRRDEEIDLLSPLFAPTQKVYSPPSYLSLLCNPTATYGACQPAVVSPASSECKSSISSSAFSSADSILSEETLSSQEFKIQLSGTNITVPSMVTGREAQHLLSAGNSCINRRSKKIPSQLPYSVESQWISSQKDSTPIYIEVRGASNHEVRSHSYQDSGVDSNSQSGSNLNMDSNRQSELSHHLEKNNLVANKETLKTTTHKCNCQYENQSNATSIKMDPSKDVFSDATRQKDYSYLQESGKRHPREVFQDSANMASAIMGVNPPGNFSKIGTEFSLRVPPGSDPDKRHSFPLTLRQCHRDYGGILAYLQCEGLHASGGLYNSHSLHASGGLYNSHSLHASGALHSVGSNSGLQSHTETIGNLE